MINNNIEMLKSLFYNHIYKEIWKNRYSQDDPLYKLNRYSSIGCSEIYKVSGTNAAKKGVVKSKLMKSNMKAHAPNIGNTFESSTSSIAEILFNCQVLDMPGSYKTQDNYNSVSADGIGIVDVNDDILKNIIKSYSKKYDYTIKQWRLTQMHHEFNPIQIGGNKHLTINKDNNINNLKSIIALFEFKSVYSRVLNDKVKNEYKFQVLAGMDILKFPQLGLFLEADIKCCRSRHLWFDKSYYIDDFTIINAKDIIDPIDKDLLLPNIIDKKRNPDFTKNINKSYKETPFIIGMKYLFCDDPNLKKDKIYHHNLVYKSDNYDFEWLKLYCGNNYIEIDGPLFKQNKDKSVEIIHNEKLKNIYNYNLILPDEFTKKSIIHFYRQLGEILHKETNCFAYIPWKLIGYHAAIYYPIPGFINLWKSDTIKVIDSIKVINNLETEEEKQEYINKTFKK